VFTVEACIRSFALGVRGYFASGWNCYDFSATFAAVLALVVVSIRPELTALAMARPLRLLRLFKLKKRFRDVFGTLFLLLPLMSSAALVLILLYYFFAIIGMELFAGYEMRNCCVLVFVLVLPLKVLSQQTSLCQMGAQHHSFRSAGHDQLKIMVLHHLLTQQPSL
jgi:hypothetical protein